jgi:hypothetical protein
VPTQLEIYSMASKQIAEIVLSRVENLSDEKYLKSLTFVFKCDGEEVFSPKWGETELKKNGYFKPANF